LRTEGSAVDLEASRMAKPMMGGLLRDHQTHGPQ